MLGIGKPLSYEDMVKRHRELVAQKAERARHIPPPDPLTLPPPAIPRAKTRSGKRAHRRTQPLPPKLAKSAYATANDPSMDNAFNRMLVEAARLCLTQQVFTWQELCAACFEADPALFSMAGFPQWPDGTKVKIRLAHGKYLRNHKLVVPATHGRYHVTPAGMARASSLSNGNPTP